MTNDLNFQNSTPDERKKAIIFDAGGVLLKIDNKTKINEFLKYLPPVDPIKLEALLYNSGNSWQNKLQLEYHLGNISSRDFYNSLMHFIPFDKSFTYEIFINLWPARFEPNIELFKFIHDELGDYKKYILSDTNELDMGWIIQTYKGIFIDFDKLFFSYETHIDKLNRKAWEQIVDVSKLSVIDHIYIDDVQSNTQRAEQLGMKTLLYTNLEDLKSNPLFNSQV